ncbi:MAG: hypothetical protein ABSB19_15725 [Methylomonas sp.]
MNIKITALSAGFLAVLSNTVNATTATPAEAPAAPGIYANGPASPNLLVTVVALSDAERTAFALFEGVMQVVEAQIHATTCTPLSYSVSIYADGSLNNPTNNLIDIVTVGSNVPEFGLVANVQPESIGRGKQIAVSLAQVGSFNGTAIRSFSSNYVYNNFDNILVGNFATTNLIGINGLPDTYTGDVIKDFYMGNVTDPTNPDYYNVIDWGVQSVSKLGYPVDKWWQRSKTHRDDGDNGRTTFVKDRLVGVTLCRITIDTTGLNDGYNVFWEGYSNPDNYGTLTVSPVAPGAPVLPDVNGVEAWDQYPYNDAADQ